uniref:NADH-ubiquinone oxidoreductase chain 4L n=1 Tax=Buthus occitanus TaxID=6868 RepID=B2CKW6_BUTOI|nr:NADH dehydrogenase subunit 4L [Buthus occitanus]ACA66074.1 NADH dehydrogenase subunit 4L [Buthus occitanus]
MSNYFFYLGLFSFIISILSLISRIKHILPLLLSIEMIILSVFILMASVSYMKNFDGSLFLIFLCLAVCEGTLGLSILISISRQFGNTFITSTNLL